MPTDPEVPEVKEAAQQELTWKPVGYGECESCGTAAELAVLRGNDQYGAKICRDCRIDAAAILTAPAPSQVETPRQKATPSKAIELARAVLLFHSIGPWTDEKRAEWTNLTGSLEATTLALCDFARRISNESE